MAQSTRQPSFYYLSPPTGGVDTRVYETNLAEGEYTMLRNIDVSSKIGSFSTRPGAAIFINSNALGAIRALYRWYYGNGSSALIVITDTAIYKWAGGTTFTQIYGPGTGNTITAHTYWTFCSFNDVLYMLNGVDPVIRWTGSGNARAAGYNAPGAAPSVATGAAGILNGAYEYAVTFVYDGLSGSESTLGAASAVVNPANQQVNLTAIPVGGSGTTSRNIYRTKAGQTQFFFLATINDNSTTTYTDNASDSALGTNQAPQDNGRPPIGQFGLFWRGRFVIANGYTVYMSSTSSNEGNPGGGGNTIHGAGPEIFPALNYLLVGDDNTPVSGLGVILDRLVVFKKQAIYTVQGDNASNMTVSLCQAETGCIAPKTIVNIQGSIIFLGRTDGVPQVYSFDGDRAEPLSTPIEPTLKARMVNLGLTDQTSVDLQPTAVRYRGTYMLWYVYQTNPSVKWEAAVFDMRPPQMRWVFWDGWAPNNWTAMNGPGDSGQILFSDSASNYICQIDQGSQDFNSGSAVSVTATIQTKWLDMGKPHCWKQFERIETFARANNGATVQVERFYNLDTVGIQDSAMSMAPFLNSTEYFNLFQLNTDLSGSDFPSGKLTATQVEQGFLMRIQILLTSSASAPAEIEKVRVCFRMESEDQVRRPS